MTALRNIDSPLVEQEVLFSISVSDPSVDVIALG
jgi:hypothetical protein